MARFSCTRCKLTTDDEDKIIDHVWNENECDSSSYRDKELSE